MKSGSKNEDRSISFSSPMVDAILENRKSITRRIIKPQPTLIENSQRWFWSENSAVSASREWWEYMDTLKMCPYGQIGDRLWVKETFCLADHSTRWASRILLEIINIKVEKIRDISTEDCIKEGWPGLPIAKHLSERWFQDLWESIYGPRSWELNPWVWAIEFRVVENFKA
jgi:hypothetical protein